MAEEHAGKNTSDDNVVRDKGESRWSDLLRLEDYWAIWLGFLILIIGLAIFLPRPLDGMKEIFSEQNDIMSAEANTAPFKTIAWIKASSEKEKLKATNSDIAKKLKVWLSPPQGWKNNPVESFVLSEEAAAARSIKGKEKYEKAQAETASALSAAQEAEDASRAAGFKDEKLNAAAKSAIAAWKEVKADESAAKKKTDVKPYNRIPYLIGLGVALALFFGIGTVAMGRPLGKFLAAFPTMYLIAVLAYMMEVQSTMKEYGIGFAAWAIIFGMLISNTIGTPKWMMPAVQVEYYIKTGLVLLGAEVLFAKILAIGIPGIFVAWVVTPIVLISTFIFGQKVLKMESKTLNITISADMSVCGVSAAIATASACRAKKEELTLAVGISLVFTAIMMVVIPNVAKAIGMDHVLAGAWLGGTIDATGAVAAAGGFLSERALYVAATIKMIQNILIGVIAFGVAVYWCAKYECEPDQKVSAMEIWYRFPKFVLGFISASILFSILFQSMGGDAGYTMLDNGVIRGFTRDCREWFFCLAFTSIGLATNFRELSKYFKGGKPVILYICGQSLNLILTLLMAWLMFYKVFPNITANI